MNRQCYICLDTQPDDDSEWVSPCRCTGTIQWVHQVCLLTWVEQHESLHPQVTPRCPNCLTSLNLGPGMGPVVKVLKAFNSLLPPRKINLPFLNYLSIMPLHGLHSLILAYGKSEAVKMMTRWGGSTPLNLIAVSSLIVVLNNAPWEKVILHSLRRGSHLPIIGAILPSEPKSVQRYGNFPVRDEAQELTVSVLETYLLAPIAKLVGDTFFWLEPDHKRIFIGGVVYLAVRGVLTMYYRQKLTLNLVVRKVMPFVSN